MDCVVSVGYIGLTDWKCIDLLTNNAIKDLEAHETYCRVVGSVDEIYSVIQGGSHD
jgi:hypothetical protein